jgi:hypothetical protein
MESKTKDTNQLLPVKTSNSENIDTHKPCWSQEESGSSGTLYQTTTQQEKGSTQNKKQMNITNTK